ncbi:hypothetical protein D3C76_847840 [compost metagenome]
MFKQQKCRGPELKDLTAEFGADGASGTCDQNGLPLDAVLKQLPLGRNSITAEQVSNVYFLDVVDLDPATGQIHEPRDTPNMQRETFEKTKNLAAATTIGRRDGKENFLSARALDHLLDMFRLIDLQP